MTDMSRERGSGLKFAALSLTGAILFFVPVWDGNIPVVAMINLVKGLMGNRLEWLAVLSCLTLAAELAGDMVFHIPMLSGYFKGQGIRKIFWMASAVIVILKISGSTLPFMVHPQIGQTILTLGSGVFITIAVAGTLVVFIIQSGIVEFVSVLLEPVMEPVFLLPGEAAVNILSSFVSSASVGVYFTEQYYERKRYTMRQACSVVTSFSVVSVGYIGIIASLSGIPEKYGVLLAASFVLVLVMGAVMIRIPPLSRISDCYIDGSKREMEENRMDFRSRFRLAWETGIGKSKGFTAQVFLHNAIQSLQFAQKIVGVMIPTVMMVLILVYYTPLFTWLGVPLVPVLKVLGIPDAALAAPSVLVGIVEVSLPSILVGGTQAAAETKFFVALLSIVQIIFFSEAGNAILGSRIPLGALKLVEIFLIRTAVALPLAALVTHVVYLVI